MRVAVLHDPVAPDAPPDEQDNLDQARAVAGALRELGHAARLVPFSLDLAALSRDLERERPDAVFNLVETVAGSVRLAHLAPALAGFLGLPCTGADEWAMLSASAKDRTKEVLRGRGLPTPDWLALPLAGRLPEPGAWIVKPVWEHGSVGIDEDSVLEGADPQELAERLDRRAGDLGLPCLAERFVDGREFNIAVLDGPGGPRVLPLAELVFRDFGPDRRKVVGYRAKWAEDSFEYAHTVRTFEHAGADAGLLKELADLTLACVRAFGLTGYARVDWRVDPEGRPFIIDLNTNPCLTPGAGLPEAARRAGLDYPDLIGAILDAALR